MRAKSLLDEAIDNIRAVGHLTHGRKAHEHVEYAVALLREAWIDLDGQNARTAEQVVADVGTMYRLSQALFKQSVSRCTRGAHAVQDVCPDAFGVPCSPPA